MIKNLKCIFISPVYAASSSKCAMLTIYACGDSGSSAASGDHGHAWLTITNCVSYDLQFLSYTIKPGKTMSVSRWGESGFGEGGLYLNLEQMASIGTRPTLYSMMITMDQLEKIEKETPKESKYGDLWDNCTTYSATMWNLVADKSHQISDGPLSIDIPGNVANEIGSWTGSVKASYYNGDPKIKWTDIYFIEKTGELKCVGFSLISPTNLKLNTDEKYKIQVKTKGSEGSIQWSSSNKAIASVDKNGVVSAKQKGTAVITGKYGNATVTVQVSVVKKSLQLSPQKVKLKVGGKRKLIATVSGVSRKVNWSSSNKKVAKVSNGTIKAVGAGSATITATANGISKTCKVTVKAKKSLKLNKSSVTLEKGNTYKLIATVTGMKKSVTWNSSNKKIATVKDGVVTGKGKGTATITAQCGGKTAKCKVKVKKNNGIYHTEKGNVTYENYSSVFDLKATIKDNKLIIQGELAKYIYGNDGMKGGKVSGKKHIFVLSSQARFWGSDGTISKNGFIKASQRYRGDKGILLQISMENGKVAGVGLGPAYALNY